MYSESRQESDHEYRGIRYNAIQSFHVYIVQIESRLDLALSYLHHMTSLKQLNFLLLDLSSSDHVATANKPQSPYCTPS